MPTAPWPLRVAGLLAGAEGVATAVIGVREILSLSEDRLVIGLTTGLFFLAYGGVLIAAGVGLWRASAWARGPVLVAQLVWLFLAWSLRSGPTTLLALLLALSSVVVLAGLLPPGSTRALEASRDGTTPPG